MKNLTPIINNPFSLWDFNTSSGSVKIKMNNDCTSDFFSCYKYLLPLGPGAARLDTDMTYQHYTWTQRKRQLGRWTSRQSIVSCSPVRDTARALSVSRNSCQYHLSHFAHEYASYPNLISGIPTSYTTSQLLMSHRCRLQIPSLMRRTKS